MTQTHRTTTGTIIYKMVEDNIEEITKGIQDDKMMYNERLRMSGHLELF